MIAAALLGMMAAPAVVPLILDTDMGGDCDDAGALAILHAMEDLGETRLLAITSCTSARYTPGCISAINAYYGRPEIPVGALAEDGFMADMDRKYCRQVATTFPATIRERSQCPPALSLLRETLSAQPDGVTELCAIGPLRNIRQLLESLPDAASPLSGRELVARKVKRLTIMGGFFGAQKPFEQAGEWNFAQDPQSAAIVAELWPTEILYVGWELGDAIPTGGGLSSKTPESNPVRRSYELYLEGPHRSRPSFDLIAVHVAVRGPGALWGLGPAGRCVVDPASGANTWEAEPEGKDRYLTLAVSAEQAIVAIEELLLQPPALSR
jgi:hypothetical protein